MTLFLIWLTVAIISMSTLCYAIGRALPEDENGEVGGLLFVSAAASIFWPVLLIAAIVAGPFVIPYKLGVRRKNINKNKEKMWKTLKQ